jgi:hypothetical protein
MLTPGAGAAAGANGLTIAFLHGLGGMIMLAMAVQWLLFAAIAALGIAALMRYLRSPSR